MENLLLQAKFYFSWAGGPVLIVRTATCIIDPKLYEWSLKNVIHHIFFFLKFWVFFASKSEF